MNKPLLTICIPTNGVVKWVLPAIDSIYEEADDLSVFEVVISDNGIDDELKEAIKKYSYSNLHYQKTTAQGFLNQICSFEMAQGVFLKFHNHRAKFKSGTLKYLLNLIEINKSEQPLIYLSNGVLNNGDIQKFHSLNDFTYALSHYTSWSFGLTMWRDDFYKLKNIEPNKMFPHIHYLLQDNVNSYIVVDKILHEMPDEAGKGGYNLYRTFAVDYLDIMQNLQNTNRITKKTFNHVKKDLYYNLLIPFYYTLKIRNNRNYRFTLDGIKESISVYYGLGYYYWMIMCASIYSPIKIFYTKIKHNILRKKRS